MSNDTGVVPELRRSPTSSEYADEKATASGSKREDDLAHEEEEEFTMHDVYAPLHVCSNMV